MLESKLYFLSKKQLYSRSTKRLANPLYLKSCAFFGALLVDRTGTLDTGLDFTVIDSIPQLSTELSFEEICEIRAKEICDLSEGKLKVLWSGGIDSTVALISLINELGQRDQLTRLVVLLSEESVIEFGNFYQNVIIPELNIEWVKSTIYESILPDEVIVTGEHGDQLFGSDKLKIPVITGDAYRNHEEVLEFLISRKLGTDTYTTDLIEYLKPQIAKAPFPIHSLFDYFWWMNFSLKWQNVSMRLVEGLDRNVEALDTTVFHFFRSELFQQWSIANHDSKIKGDWKTYKYVAKEYIHKHFPDEEYLYQKEKEPSLKEVLVADKEFSLLRLPAKIYRSLTTVRP